MKNHEEYPKRILQVVSIMDLGGLETFIMNVYRNIDKKKIQFDFLVHHEKIGVYEKEILKLGGKIYRIPFVTKVGHFGYIKALNKFFKENKYEVVHSHFNTISGLILREAKKNGVKYRIAHSHIAYPKYKFLENLYKIYAKSFINRVGNIKFSCGKDAGEWLYGKDSSYDILMNGIDIDDFKFNFETKKLELGFQETDLLIGHVGRFNKQKNHKFLIEIFSEIENVNIKLILIGDGELREEIEQQIKKLGLEKRVILLGLRQDVKELLNIFDIVVLPSLYEGLPVTLIENQANGLKSFISDTVDKKADLGCDLIEFISLEKTAKEWAKIIEKDLKLRNYVDNKKNNEQLKKNGYDIRETAKYLEKIYLDRK